MFIWTLPGTFQSVFSAHRRVIQPKSADSAILAGFPG
jgi:hypothetical protein